MIGLSFLLALIACAVLGVWLVRFVGRMVPEPKWKAPVMMFVSVLLIAAPFVDELIGKYQFEALCKANGIESVDVSTAKGKRVKVNYSERHPVHGVFVPMMESDVFFRDVDTNTAVIHHKNYYATGGWLMRYTPLSMGSDNPMLFSGNGCGFSQREKLFKLNQISEID